MFANMKAHHIEGLNFPTKTGFCAYSLRFKMSQETKALNVIIPSGSCLGSLHNISGDSHNILPLVDTETLKTALLYLSLLYEYLHESMNDLFLLHMKDISNIFKGIQYSA